MLDVLYTIRDLVYTLIQPNCLPLPLAFLPAGAV